MKNSLKILILLFSFLAFAKTQAQDCSATKHLIGTPNCIDQCSDGTFTEQADAPDDETSCKCQNSHKFYDLTMRNCISACPANQVPITIDGTSFQKCVCDINKGYVMNETNNDCILCTSSQKIGANGNSCVELCNQKSEVETTINNFKVCMCKIDHGYALNDTKDECVFCQKDNQIVHPTRNSCVVSCNSNEALVQSKSFRKCVECVDSTPIVSLNGKTCVNDCPQGTRKVSNKCYPCTSDNCSIMCDPTKPFLKSDQKECVNKCLILNNETQQCIETKSECKGIIQIDQKSCDSTCLNGQVITQQSDYKQCQKCDHFISNDSSQCLEECPPGSIKVEDSINYCKFCSGKTPILDSLQNECVASCEDKEILISQNGFQQCKLCEDGKVINPQKDKCVDKCEDPFVNVNNICVCKDGLFFSTFDQTCLTSCQDVLEIQDINFNNCISCFPLQLKIENNISKCVNPTIQTLDNKLDLLKSMNNPQLVTSTISLLLEIESEIHKIDKVADQFDKLAEVSAIWLKLADNIKENTSRIIEGQDKKMRIILQKGIAGKLVKKLNVQTLLTADKITLIESDSSISTPLPSVVVKVFETNPFCKTPPCFHPLIDISMNPISKRRNLQSSALKIEGEFSVEFPSQNWSCLSYTKSGSSPAAPQGDKNILTCPLSDNATIFFDEKCEHRKEGCKQKEENSSEQQNRESSQNTPTSTTSNILIAILVIQVILLVFGLCGGAYLLKK